MTSICCQPQREGDTRLQNNNSTLSTVLDPTLQRHCLCKSIRVGCTAPTRCCSAALRFPSEPVPPTRLGLFKADDLVHDRKKLGNSCTSCVVKAKSRDQHLYVYITSNSHNSINVRSIAYMYSFVCLVEYHHDCRRWRRVSLPNPPKWVSTAMLYLLRNSCHSGDDQPTVTLVGSTTNASRFDLQFIPTCNLKLI